MLLLRWRWRELVEQTKHQARLPLTRYGAALLALFFIGSYSVRILVIIEPAKGPLFYVICNGGTSR